MTTTKGLGRRALSGMTWTLAGSLISNIARIAVVAALGRLLTPADFGVVAVAMTVVLFAARFKELGFGLALVQRKSIDQRHVATTFAVSLALGCAISAIMFVAARPIADLYDMPHATVAIQAVSVLFIIRGLSSTSRFLLQREMRFRALALISVISYLIGSAASVVLALLGYGAWALVIGYLVEAFVDGVLLWLVRPLPLPRMERTAFGELFGFGGGQVAAGFANYFANQGDYMIVGRVLGDALLGAYNRAYELMRFPAQIFNSVAGSVLFSSFAKLQDDPSRLGQMFRRVLFANALVLLPASAGLIVLAPEAIRILLGPGWDAAVLPFQIMAVSMLFRTSYKAASLVARSAGAVYRIAVWQAAYAVAVIGGALVSVRWGIAGVAATTGVAVVFHFVNLTRLALSQIHLSWREILHAHLDGLVMAGLVAAAAWPAAIATRAAGMPTAAIAALVTVAGALPPLAYAWLRVRRRDPDWLWLVERARGVGRKRRKKGPKPAEADGLQ